MTRTVDETLHHFRSSLASTRVFLVLGFTEQTKWLYNLDYLFKGLSTSNTPNALDSTDRIVSSYIVINGRDSSVSSQYGLDWAYIIIYLHEVIKPTYDSAQGLAG